MPKQKFAVREQLCAPIIRTAMRHRADHRVNLIAGQLPTWGINARNTTHQIGPVFTLVRLIGSRPRIILHGAAAADNHTRGYDGGRKATNCRIFCSAECLSTIFVMLKVDGPSIAPNEPLTE